MSLILTPLLSVIAIALSERENNPVENYGRWCGPGHGGYDDCCNGSFCPSCGPGPLVGNFNFTLNLACLKECPPVDMMDLACAQHDTCCSVFGTSCGTFLKDQHCFCNSLLSKLACSVYPYSRVCFIFSSLNYGMDCWGCGQNTTSPKQCYNEHNVYNFGPNLTIALEMLERFNATGQTFFKEVSSEFGQNCSGN